MKTSRKVTVPLSIHTDLEFLIFGYELSRYCLATKANWYFQYDKLYLVTKSHLLHHNRRHSSELSIPHRSMHHISGDEVGYSIMSKFIGMCIYVERLRNCVFCELVLFQSLFWFMKLQILDFDIWFMPLGWNWYYFQFQFLCLSVALAMHISPGSSNLFFK